MPHTKNNDIVITDLEPPVSLPEGASESLEQNQTLSLVYALNSSLDIHIILQQFLQGIRQTIACDGLHYQHDETGLNVTVGETADHQYRYQLTLENATLGTLTFFNRNEFEESDTVTLENILCLLLYPLRNSISHYIALESAQHDPLTGAANRSVLMPSLRRDIQLAQRHNMPLAVLALDLDHFKNVNDNFGHAGGDEILKSFVDIMNECVRDSDLVCRVGGEEFIIMLTKTDLQGAKKLAERIRGKVQNTVCKYKDNELSITVSIGIALYEEGDNHTNLLERADRALYQAKQEGRNRVVS